MYKNPLLTVLINIIFILIPVATFAQNDAEVWADTLKPTERFDYNQYNLGLLKKRGVTRTKQGKDEYSDEVVRILRDKDYRASIYESPRTFSAAAKLWREKEYLRAMWVYCFLYDKNPKMVLRQLIYTDANPHFLAEGGINAFWTYGWFDPTFVRFESNGRYNVHDQANIEPLVIKFQTFSHSLHSALVVPMEKK